MIWWCHWQRNQQSSREIWIIYPVGLSDTATHRVKPSARNRKYHQNEFLSLRPLTQIHHEKLANSASQHLISVINSCFLRHKSKQRPSIQLRAGKSNLGLTPPVPSKTSKSPDKDKVYLTIQSVRDILQSGRFIYKRPRGERVDNMNKDISSWKSKSGSGALKAELLLNLRTW